MKTIYEKGDILKNKKHGDTIVVLTRPGAVDLNDDYGCLVITDEKCGFFITYNNVYLNDNTDYVGHDDNVISIMEDMATSLYWKLKGNK